MVVRGFNVIHYWVFVTFVDRVFAITGRIVGLKRASGGHPAGHDWISSQTIWTHSIEGECSNTASADYGLRLWCLRACIIRLVQKGRHMTTCTFVAGEFSFVDRNERTQPFIGVDSKPKICGSWCGTGINCRKQNSLPGYFVLRKRAGLRHCNTHCCTFEAIHAQVVMQYGIC